MGCVISKQEDWISICDEESNKEISRVRCLDIASVTRRETRFGGQIHFEGVTLMTFAGEVEIDNVNYDDFVKVLTDG